MLYLADSDNLNSTLILDIRGYREEEMTSMKRILICVSILAHIFVFCSIGVAYAGDTYPTATPNVTSVPRPSNTPQPPIPTFYVTEWAASPQPTETSAPTDTESPLPTPPPTTTEIPETIVPMPSDTPVMTSTSYPYPIMTNTTYPYPIAEVDPMPRHPKITPTLPVTGGGLESSLPLMIVAMVVLLGIAWIIRAIRTSNGRVDS